MPNMEVLDDESLLRLTFAPEHFVDGRFQQGAVALEDLKKRGVSVDRTALTTKCVVLRRVNEQSSRKPGDRELPVFSLLRCGDVRSESDENGVPCFKVEASPTDENPGHASIFSTDRTLGKGALRKLRDKLLAQMADTLVPLDDAFSNIQAQAVGSDLGVQGEDSTPPTA